MEGLNIALKLFRDVFDVLIVASIIYAILLMIQGTRAFKMLVGLAVIVAIYFISLRFKFFTLYWILEQFLVLLPILVIVIFQSEIRKVLTRVGRNPFKTISSLGETKNIFEEIVKAVVYLANQHIGALVVLERETGLNDYIEGGVRLDAKVTKELIVGIFQASSPLHDGAIIIQNGLISAAGCILPLVINPSLSTEYGTRHRVAVSLTEDTDAVVIVVSEENGLVSLVVNGKLTKDVDGVTLEKVLINLFQKRLRHSVFSKGAI